MTVASISSDFIVRTVPSSDEAAVASLLDRASRRNAPLERRVARIVEDVRRDGDTALLAYAQQFDQLVEPMEVSREEIRRGARTVPPAVRTALATAADHIRRVASKQVPRGWVVAAHGRRANRAARAPARPRRLLRAGRPLSAPVVSAHDRHPGTRGRGR